MSKLTQEPGVIWTTTDGCKFTNEEDATKHQDELDKGRKVYESLSPIEQQRMRRLVVFSLGFDDENEEDIQDVIYDECGYSNFVKPQRFYEKYNEIRCNSVEEIINLAKESAYFEDAMTGWFDLDADNWKEPLEFKITITAELVKTGEE